MPPRSARPCRSLIYVFLVSLAAGGAWAQETRGSITGKVTDPQGAVVPGAAVSVLNTETNAVNRTAANETGYFEVNLLNPGSYSLAVEAAGFKKFVRTGLVLNVAGRLDIEAQLQVGQLAETVEVTAAAPLLDTTTASGGRVIDNRQIMQLPFADMNPFALSALAPGMQWTGQPEYNRPFDNGGTSAFNTMGGVGQNEYTIGGALATDRRVAFVPPSDAVEEFKLETTTFDSSYGHTSGATINVDDQGRHQPLSRLAVRPTLAAALERNAALHPPGLGRPGAARPAEADRSQASHRPLEQFRRHARRAGLHSRRLPWPRQALLLLQLQRHLPVQSRDHQLHQPQRAEDGLAEGRLLRPPGHRRGPVHGLRPALRGAAGRPRGAPAIPGEQGGAGAESGLQLLCEAVPGAQ